VAALEARLAALVERAEAGSAAFCRDAAPEALEARERRLREREALLRQELSAALERREAARAGERARLAALRALRAELERQEAVNAGARALRCIECITPGLFSHLGCLYEEHSCAAPRSPRRPPLTAARNRNPQPQPRAGLSSDLVAAAAAGAARAGERARLEAPLRVAADQAARLDAETCEARRGAAAARAAAAGAAAELERLRRQNVAARAALAAKREELVRLRGAIALMAPPSGGGASAITAAPASRGGGGAYGVQKQQQQQQQQPGHHPGSAPAAGGARALQPAAPADEPVATAESNEAPSHPPLDAALLQPSPGALALIPSGRGRGRADLSPLPPLSPHGGGGGGMVALQQTTTTTVITRRTAAPAPGGGGGGRHGGRGGGGEGAGGGGRGGYLVVEDTVRVTQTFVNASGALPTKQLPPCTAPPPPHDCSTELTPPSHRTPHTGRPGADAAAAAQRASRGD